MSRLVYYLIIVFLVSINSMAKQLQNDLFVKIDRFIIDINGYGFSGSILVAKEGEILISKGYGIADSARNIAITNKTVFTIGSITKQFTAAAILKLQMQDKVNVKDPITKYFSTVPEDKQSITLHHLLTHSAGFPGAIGDDFEPISRDEYIQRAMNRELLHPPGKEYQYSNVGYSLLAAIIEIVSGKSYEIYLSENLFQAAGMTQTGYLLPQWKSSELAHGYRNGNDWGTLLEKSWADDGPYWNLRGNGGIHSTVEDMYQWHVALQGDQILSQEAKRLYYTPHIREGEDADSFYGYGWAIFSTMRNTRLIAHNGGNMIFSADFLRYLDEDVVVIVLANISGKPAWRVSSQIARIVFGYDYSNPFSSIHGGTDEDTHLDLSGDEENTALLKKWDLPSSNTGLRAAQLLEAIDRVDKDYAIQFIETSLAPDFLDEFSLDEHWGQFKRMHSDLGKIELVAADKTSPTSASLKVKSKQSGDYFKLLLELEPDEPWKIIGISVESE